MTAETKVVSQMSEEADFGVGVEETKIEKETGLGMALPIDMVQDVNEVSHSSTNGNATAVADETEEDITRSSKDEMVDPENEAANGMGGVGGGDPDQNSYVFVDSHNGGGGDSSSDWDLNVEEEDVETVVPQAETEADYVGTDVVETPLTHLPAQTPMDIISSSAVLLSPSEEENQNQNVTDVLVADVVASEKKQQSPHHLEEAAAAAVLTEDPQLEPVASVVPELVKEQDQVESGTSLSGLDVDNLKSTATTTATAAAVAAESGNVPQSHEQEEVDSSESMLVSETDEDKVREAVNPHDVNNIMFSSAEEKKNDHLNNVSSTTTMCTIADCNNSNDEEAAQVMLVSDASKTNADTSDCLLRKNPNEEVEVMLDTSNAEPGVVVQGVKEEESLAKASECTSLEVELESDLLNNGEVEKLEQQRGEETCFKVTEKQHEEGLSHLKVDDSPDINVVDQEGSEEAAELSHGTDILLEPDTKLEHVLTDSNARFLTSKLEEEVAYSVTKGPSDCAVEYAAAQNNSSSEDHNNLHLSDDSMKPETEGFDGTEDGNYLSCSVNNAVEVEVTTVFEEVIETSGAEKASDWPCTDIDKEESSQPLATDDMDSVNGDLAHDSGKTIAADVMTSNLETHNSSVTNGMHISCIDAAVISQSPVQFGSFVPGLYQADSIPRDDSSKITCEEPKHSEQVQSKPPPSLGGFTSHPVVEQSVPVKVEPVERPFNFLIKMPRYYDDQLSEQIKQAELQVAEKIQKRDAIGFTLQMIRGNVQQAQSVYAATLSEERAARRSVRLKRQEIDSVQSIINRVKNALFVKEIDVRIKHMEHMMQHETLPLKEEKQFIREIKQLKHHRDQLSSNMGSQDEVQKALDEKEQTEDQLKILKKELDCLKNKVSTAEATAVAADKKLKDEKKRLQEVLAQHATAYGVYQEARAKMQNLKRQSNEKNTWFWAYKDNAKAAYDYASSGDKEAIHRLCLNQVEKMMTMWNNDDEFRKEYTRCNTRSTMGRLRTMDGRALGPDEVLPVVPSFINERVKSSRYHKVQPQSNTELLVVSDKEKREQGGIPTNKEEEAAVKEEGKKSVEKVAAQLRSDEAEKAKKHGKPTTMPNNSLVGSVERSFEKEEECNKNNENNKQTKEEQEAARNAEQLRKAEEEAKLKEQRRLEEIAKAKEALERKKKNAEARAIRAEARALKEAELKEKEKEKRAKKKERKRGGGGSDSNHIEGGDVTTVSEIVKDDGGEGGPPPSAAAANKRPQKAAYNKHQNKVKAASSIPPHLRNKNKRRLQQWIWIFVSIAFLVALFLLTNMGGLDANPFSHDPHMGNPNSGGGAF